MHVVAEDDVGEPVAVDVGAAGERAAPARVLSAAGSSTTGRPVASMARTRSGGAVSAR